MIVVRNSFTAKAGCASKLAAQLKEAAAVVGLSVRILTDMTGEFNRVIMEYEADNVGAFETMMTRYRSDEAFRAKMAGYTDLYITGSREILQVM